MFFFNGNPILDGNIKNVDIGYIIEDNHNHFLSENETELIFNPTNKGSVSSFQSNIQLDQLNESIEFVIWSLDDIFISVNYELKTNVDKFYPLILHFDDIFDNIISNDGISSDRTIIFNPVEGFALLNSNKFFFIGNRDSSNEMFDVRVDDGGNYVLYVVMNDPPKKGHFIVSLKYLIKDEDVEEQFNKYSNSFLNPPSVSIGPEQYHPSLIENCKNSIDTEVKTKFIKPPLFIREGDESDFEIEFSSNKPAYVEASINTRLGQEIINEKNLEKYFDQNYTYKTSMVAPNSDAMPWQKESKLKQNLIYFYGSKGEGSNSFQTILISNYFIRSTYFIYLIIITLIFGLIYGSSLKSMDEYPLLLSLVVPIIFIIANILLNDHMLYYSGKINIQKPLMPLVEICVSIGFLFLFSIFMYQCTSSLSNLNDASVKDFVLLMSSIPIFYVNGIWLIVPMLFITFEIIANINSIVSCIFNFIKK